LDFALWKKADAHHIMKWPSPWGMGFPGWHLECSAMSTKYLGETFDIHGGGMDLKFPHHECEIAQNKAATGKLSCRYWMHGNMLTVNGTKMSKSLGNSFLPNELITGNHPLLQKAYSPMTVRFFMLQAHYAGTLDFTNEGLEAAEKGLKRLMNALSTLKKLEHTAKTTDETLGREVNRLLDACFVNLSDDFNTAKCLAVLFELISIINNSATAPANAPGLAPDVLLRLKKEFADLIENVLGLRAEAESGTQKLDAAMQVLIRLRENARTERNWALSDTIRDELAAVGIRLKDSKEGTAYELD
jgi:cysteinyl-tRNA synthetase